MTMKALYGLGPIYIMNFHCNYSSYTSEHNSDLYNLQNTHYSSYILCKNGCKIIDALEANSLNKIMAQEDRFTLAFRDHY